MDALHQQNTRTLIVWKWKIVLRQMLVSQIGLYKWPRTYGGLSEFSDIPND